MNPWQFLDGLRRLQKGRFLRLAKEQVVINPGHHSTNCYLRRNALRPTAAGWTLSRRSGLRFVTITNVIFRSLAAPFDSSLERPRLSASEHKKGRLPMCG